MMLPPGRIFTCLVFVFLCASQSLRSQESTSGREVAITFDDLPTVALDTSAAVAQEITRDLLDKLVSGNVPATAFVVGGKLTSGGKPDSMRIALLDEWLTNGFQLGNHTYSHKSLNRTDLREYERDVLEADTVLRAVLDRRGKSLAYFRHPMLQTGRSIAVRDSFLAFLSRRGYRVAPVTIDNSDWIFARAFDRALARQDSSMAVRIVEEYLPYMEGKFAYYEGRSLALFGREIRQVLLLHANRLNARTFDGLAAMMRRRGYHFIDLDRALQDPAYASADTFTGGGGISWIDRWALTAGKGKAFFQGEPHTPSWIMREAGVESE